MLDNDENLALAKDDAIKTREYCIYPSQLFSNVTANAHNNDNLNTDLAAIFAAIENSANGYDSEQDIKGLFADFDTTSNRLGNTVEAKNKRLSAVLKGVAGLNLGHFEGFADHYKGYVAENFVQQELVALGIDPTFSWSDARAEIEFVISDVDGKIIPIEVKSGKRTRARSLESYINKCEPHKSIKLTGTQGSAKTETKHLAYPLYYCEHAIKQHVLN
jgi:hypothetical protein